MLFVGPLGLSFTRKRVEFLCAKVAWIFMNSFSLSHSAKLEECWPLQLVHVGTKSGLTGFPLTISGQDVVSCFFAQYIQATGSQQFLQP